MMLTLVSRVDDLRIHNRVAGIFRCDCGREKVLPIDRVERGTVKSCGCLRRSTKPGLTHGMRGTTEYQTWSSMKDRCTNPNSKDYGRWGGRGIAVHPEWLESFEAFYSYLGPKPPGTSLDRIDSNGDYAPGNVRWATAEEQAKNRLNGWIVRIGDRTFASVEEAARAMGVSATSVVRWCRSGKNGAKRWRAYP